MSFTLTDAFIRTFADNVGRLMKHRDPPPFADLGSRAFKPLSAEERSRRDIEAVREALKRAHRRDRKMLTKRLRRMEDKYAQRSLLGWDWLAAHPDHPLHIAVGPALDVPEFLRSGRVGRVYGMQLLKSESIVQMAAAP